MPYTLSQAEAIVNHEGAVTGVFSDEKLRAAVAVVLTGAASWQSTACAEYIRDCVLSQ